MVSHKKNTCKFIAMGGCASREYRRNEKIEVDITEAKLDNNGCLLAPATVLKLRPIVATEATDASLRAKYFEPLRKARNDALVLTMFNNASGHCQARPAISLEAMMSYYEKFADGEVETNAELMSSPDKVSPRPCMVLVNNVEGFAPSDDVPIGYVGVVNTMASTENWGAGIWLGQSHRRGDNRISFLAGALGAWAYLESCARLGVAAQYKPISFETKVYNHKLQSAFVDFLVLCQDVLGVGLHRDDLSIQLRTGAPIIDAMLSAAVVERICLKLHRFVAQTKHEGARGLLNLGVQVDGAARVNRRRLVVHDLFPAAFASAFEKRELVRSEVYATLKAWEAAQRMLSTEVAILDEDCGQPLPERADWCALSKRHRPSGSRLWFKLSHVQRCPLFSTALHQGCTDASCRIVYVWHAFDDDCAIDQVSEADPICVVTSLFRRATNLLLHTNSSSDEAPSLTAMEPPSEESPAKESAESLRSSYYWNPYNGPCCWHFLGMGPRLVHQP